MDEFAAGGFHLSVEIQPGLEDELDNITACLPEGADH
jgi:hypothetical protein